MAPRPDADRVDARTVLLADDDEDFRTVLAETLAEDGHEVIAVPNGTAALTLTPGRLIAKVSTSANVSEMPRVIALCGGSAWPPGRS